MSKKKRKHSLLWKAIDKDTSIESYIYGTIHIRDEQVYFLFDLLKKLIAGCEVFIAEYPLDSDNSEFIQYMHFENEGHLRDFLDKKKYDKLNKQLQKTFGVDLDRLGYFKPMVIENMLTESLFGMDYPFPMDILLWNYAKSLGLELVGAETLQEQINIMKSLPVKDQVKSLVEIGRNTKKFKKKIEKLTGYYKNQNLPLLYKKSAKSLGKMRKILIYDRNVRIANTFASYAKEKKVFMAIGAGHLYGEKGVLRLIKQKGFKVVPYKEARADKSQEE